MKNFKYILTHSSANLTLEYNPLNWDSFNIVFKRSKRYHSVLRRQILDSDFPFDGKTYIDTIYAAYGIDTEIGCDIQYLDKQTQTYSSLFNGLIDLSEWSSLRDTTSVKIIDSSVMAKFATRDETEVPLNVVNDLDGNAVSVYDYLKLMTVFGVSIEEKAEYIDATNEISITTPKVGATSWTEWYGVSDSDYDFNTIGTDADLPDVTLGSASGPLYTNNTGATVTIRYRIVTRAVGTFNITGAGAWSWAIDVWTGKNASTHAITASDSGTGSPSIGVNETYDSDYITTTLAAGETIEIYHVWSGSVDPSTTVTPNFEFGPVRMEIFTVVAGESETYVDMPFIHELGAKLLEIMTGVSDPLNAPLFGRTDSEPRTYVSDGIYSLTGIASGLVLRGFPHDDQPIKTTFADYFESIDALFNLGCWYNGAEFSIAAKEDFYEDSKIITLGEVKDLEISVSADDYFNKIEGGYRDVSYEESNGQQVPNVSTEFVNDGKMIQNTLNVRSKYRADDYGIELSRKKDYATTFAEDTKYDAEKFFLSGVRSGITVHAIKGSDYDTVTGVYSPSTRLNLDITPKRNLLRQANRLAIPSFISNSDSVFLQSQYELDLESKKLVTDDLIVERDDITYSEEPLYYPEVYNFTSELSVANIAQLISDPHGYVEFQYLGVTYTGFILEVSTEPFNRRGNWTLIKRNPNR